MTDLHPTLTPFYILFVHIFLARRQQPLRLLADVDGHLVHGALLRGVAAARQQLHDPVARLLVDLQVRLAEGLSNGPRAAGR